MASFSIDITDIKFAGGKTGSELITISNAPSGGIGISDTGYSTHFQVVVESSNQVYRIKTKATNTSGSSYTSYIRFYNNSDNTDYIDVAIEQYSIDTIRLYGDNIYTSGGSSFDAVIGSEGDALYVYVDAAAGAGITETITSGGDWLSKAQIYNTTTGFTRCIVSYTSNSDTSARTGTITYVENKNQNIATLSIRQNGTGGGPGSGMTITPTSLSFDADGGSKSIALTYDGGYYNIDATEVYTWTTISLSDVKKGIASGKVVVPTNTKVIERSGNIYFTDELGGSVTLPISQAGIAAELSANPSTLSFTSKGGSKTTAVTYAGTLSVATLPSWCSSSYVDVDANHRTYTITAASNKTTSSRTFNWRLDDSYNNYWVYLEQEAAPVVSLVISPSSSSVSNAAGSVNITVRSTGISNVSYTIDSEWIEFSSKSGNVYTFNYTANDILLTRKGKITFSGGDITRTFTLYQDAMDQIVISPTSSSVGTSSGSVQITVSGTSNEISYNIADNWLSYVGKSGDVYTFAYPENTSISSRSTTITFSAENAASATYNITQMAMDQITVSPSTGSVNSTSGSVQITVSGTSNEISYNISGNWLSYSSKSGNVYTFTYPENTTSVRSATVTFSATGAKSATYTITQAAPVQITVSPLTSSVDNTSGSVQVTVTGTNNIKYNIADNWLSYTSKSGNVYTFTYTGNSSINTRTTTVTFSAEGATSGVYTITQAAAPHLEVSPSLLTFDNTGGTNNVTVTYNGSLSYNTSGFPSWLNMTEVSSSSGRKVFRLTAQATSISSTRTYSVVFRDNVSEAALVVNQQGKSASFSVTPNSLTLIKEGGSTELTFFNIPIGGLGYEIKYGSGGTGWLSVSFTSNTIARVQVPVNSGSRRNADIKFYNQDNMDDFFVVSVVQNGEGFESIWMDKAYSPSSFKKGENYHYKLQNKDTSEVLFEGISVPVSDNDYPLGINVPRLVDSYISSNSIDDLKEDMVLRKLDGNISIDFIDINDASKPTLIKTFNYWNDWSGPGYNTTYDTSMVLSDPINHKGCTGMVIPFSVYDDESANYSVVETKKNGSQVNYPLGVPSDSFVYAAGEFYESKKVSFKKGGTELFSYDMDNCGNGYLIYRNRFGGWDSFLIEGNIYKYDDYNRLGGIYPKYPNNYGYNREKNIDRINIKTKYDINTGWLTDEEAQRLVFHLLSSPTIGFHSFEDRSSGTFPYYLISVSVVNTSVEYKKFRNGKKLVNYTITFEENNTNQVQR